MFDGLRKPDPDAERFVRTLRGETIPERPPLAELGADSEIMRTVVTGMLAREWVEPEKDDRASWEAYMDNVIAFWHGLGYDVVSFNRPSILTFTMHPAPDTGTGGRTQRNWMDLHRGPIASWDDFEKYPWPKPGEADLWTVKYVADRLPEGMGLVTCHCGGIYEHMSLLLSYEGLCLALYDQPELVAAVADRIGQTLVDYYRAMLAIDGVCAVLQGDDMGHRGGLLISREHLEQYAVPWHKRLAEMVHARGLPYCLHSCGQVEEIMSPMIDEVGIDAKHSFEDVIVPAADF